MKALRALGCLTLTSLVACGPKPSTVPDRDDASQDGGADADAGIAADAPLAELLLAMDTSADPCVDFYQYACGGWMANTEIPADRPFTAIIVGILDRSDLMLQEALEEAAANPGDDANKKKLGDFYAACMDEAAIDAAGAKPLEPALAKIATVENYQSALEVSAELSAWGADFFFDGGIWPDDKDPGTNILQLSQGGLGLPNREFYLREDEDSKQLLAAYEAHVAAMLQVAGDPAEAATKWAKEIVALERTLAEQSIPLEQLREAETTYNKMSVKALEKLTRGVKWRKVLAVEGLEKLEELNVRTPDFFKSSTKTLKKQKPDLLQAYMRFHLVDAAAPHLSQEIAGQAFAFTSMLTGQREQQERWKRCVATTTGLLPELVGPAYVEKAFAGDSKQVATQMIVAIEKAFEAGLDSLEWMDDKTRTRARDKAAKIINKVGYPDQWRDYGAVEVDRANYFGAYLSASQVELERQLAKAGEPVDPNEWHMPPSMLNAYANPTGMEMVFPAGILQPPVFAADQHMALNFGSIGSVMGHELTHHFDDQGRKYDASGTMQDWWEPEVQAKFEDKAACVAEAYGAYEVQPGLMVNGQQTLGENIADIGGLEAAYAAFATWAEANPEAAASPVESLTPEQIFFLAFGQTWCGKMSPEMEKMRVLSDVHSPGRFRANGATANNPKFWAAFACEEGTPMHPADACVVW